MQRLRNKIIKILLIEDDVADAELINEMLKSGDGVKFETDRIDRLEHCSIKIEESAYDVILVDLGLPDSQGLDTFVSVSKIAPAIPIIVFTGLSDEEFGNEAVHMGAQDYLIKGDVNEVLLKRSLLYAIQRKQAEEEIKKSEIKYRELSEQLSEANKLKALLLDVISHDLRNSAGVIFGFADILKARDPHNEVFISIYESSESLLKVIDNASTLTRLSIGEQINMEKLDMDTVIQDTLKTFMPSGIQSYIKLIYKSKGQLVVRANPIIAEIFRNYISNAIKYGIDGGLIEVEAGIQKGFFIFTVKDFGITIPEEKRKSIFERFFRLSAEKSEGMGLGLAIVKQISDAHHGNVWVEENPPHGNVFYFKMPIDQ